MFSKQQAQEIKTEFWTAFGKSFPRKWLLYDTKIKDFAFKFDAGPKSAAVALELHMKDYGLREAYFNKIWSLEDILKEYIGDNSRDLNFTLESGKTIARVWVELPDVSVYNKASWRDIFEFFVGKMDGFERFFHDYEDFIRAIEE